MGTRLEAERSGEIVREETLRSNVDLKNVDVKELGIFLRKNLPNKYIEENELKEYLPEKINGRKVHEDNKNRNEDGDHNEDPYKYVAMMLNMYNENFEDEEMELLQIDFENASIDDLDDDDNNHERRVGANEVYDDANEKVGE